MARSAHCIVIFGLDADGNADHAKAFIQGMADSGVGSAIKHYPGLGSVTGNTDFTADAFLIPPPRWTVRKSARSTVRWRRTLPW